MLLHQVLNENIFANSAIPGEPVVVELLDTANRYRRGEYDDLNAFHLNKVHRRFTNNLKNLKGHLQLLYRKFYDHFDENKVDKMAYYMDYGSYRINDDWIMGDKFLAGLKSAISKSDIPPEGIKAWNKFLRLNYIADKVRRVYFELKTEVRKKEIQKDRETAGPLYGGDNIPEQIPLGKGAPIENPYYEEGKYQYAGPVEDFKWTRYWKMYIDMFTRILERHGLGKPEYMYAGGDKLNFVIIAHGGQIIFERVHHYTVNRKDIYLNGHKIKLVKFVNALNQDLERWFKLYLY